MLKEERLFVLKQVGESVISAGLLHVCVCIAFCRYGYAVVSDAKTYKFGLFLFCRVATGFRGNALWAEPHNMASGFFLCSLESQTRGCFASIAVVLSLF